MLWLLGFQGPVGFKGPVRLGVGADFHPDRVRSQVVFSFRVSGLHPAPDRPVANPKGHTTVDPIKSCSAWAKWHLS